MLSPYLKKNTGERLLIDKKKKINSISVMQGWLQGPHTQKAYASGAIQGRPICLGFFFFVFCFSSPVIYLFIAISFFSRFFFYFNKILWCFFIYIKYDLVFTQFASKISSFLFYEKRQACFLFITLFNIFFFNFIQSLFYACYYYYHFIK